MSIQVSYKKQLGFFVILLVIGLFVIEGMVRVGEKTTLMNKDCYFTKTELFKDLSYWEKNILCTEYSTIEFNNDDAIRIPLPKEGQHVNINSDGFRGKKIDFSDDSYKIFFVGGSTAFGIITSSDEFTIPALLEKKLRSDGLRVDVINAGVGGYDSRDERYYIEKYLIQYSPDMIIMYDGWNDTNPKDNLTYEQFKNQSYYLNQLAEPINFSENKNQEIRTGIKSLFVEIDYRTGIGIARYFNELVYGTDIQISNNISERNLDIIESMLQDNWSNVCKFGNKNDVKIINILQPILGSSNRTLSEFEKFTSGGIQSPYLWNLHLDEKKYYPCNQVYDLRNAFEGMDGIPIFFDDGHTTDFGNEIIANQIYKKILTIVQEDITLLNNNLQVWN